MKPFSVVPILVTFIAVSVASAVDQSSRSDRVSRATMLSDQIGKIDQYLPTPTVDQRNYAKNEAQAIEAIRDEDARKKRQFALLESKEYHLVHVKDHTTELIKLLQSIIKGDVSPDEEIILWLQVASMLMDWSVFDSGLKRLEEHRVISESEVAKMTLVIPDNRMLAFYALANGIITNVVIPLHRNTRR